MFKDQETISEIKNKHKLTKLTAFFLLNTIDLEARKYHYHEIPKYYVWKTKEREWKKRKSNKTSNMLGRMYFINPNEIER